MTLRDFHIVEALLKINELPPVRVVTLGIGASYYTALILDVI